MKKILLLTAMLTISMAVAAQTYNNPRQRSNDRNIKVTKVERTSNSTIVYLRFSPNDPDDRSRLQAYPRLIDEATGKRYSATDALNFKWGTVYTGNATYKIEFPPLPRNTSVVTFREAANEENPWVISNIALPIQNQQNQSNSSQSGYNRANNSNAGQNPSNGPISASVERVWVDHGVYQNEMKGMMIHVKFNVKNALERKGKVIAYFSYQDGSALEDYNGKYCTQSGKVCASSEFSPKYTNTNYNDLKIFMPYSELHMGKGSSKLDFYLNVWIDGKNYYKGIRHKFNYNSN